eukprot:15596030-Heterocapsa_arctica.AAC.1
MEEEGEAVVPGEEQRCGRSDYRDPEAPAREGCDQTGHGPDGQGSEGGPADHGRRHQTRMHNAVHPRSGKEGLEKGGGSQENLSGNREEGGGHQRQGRHPEQQGGIRSAKRWRRRRS